MLLKSTFVTTLRSESQRSDTRGATTNSEAPAPEAAAARLLASPSQVLGGGEAEKKTSLVLYVVMRHESLPHGDIRLA